MGEKMNKIEEIQFQGEDAYEDFGYWTDKVNLQHGEIIKINIVYRKLK